MNRQLQLPGIQRGGKQGVERNRTSFTAHTYRFMEGCACVRVHACIGGARGGGWAETNRKQAFFIRASILNACLTYEAWFGATLARTLRAFFLSFSFPPLFSLFFFTAVAFYRPYYYYYYYYQYCYAILICLEFAFHATTTTCTGYTPGRGVEQVVPLLHFIFNF